MQKEASIQLTVKVTPSVQARLQKLSAKEHKPIAELIRNYINDGLKIASTKDDIGFIRKQINEELSHVLLPHVDRLVKINVKSGIVSAAGFFLAAELFASFVHESHRRDFDEAVTEAKKLAVAYFKLRDYEIDQFTREDGKFTEGLR